MASYAGLKSLVTEVNIKAEAVVQANGYTFQKGFTSLRTV